jgi:hypothetical protein
MIPESSQWPDIKPKKRRRFVSFFKPSASSNHCSASLDQNRRSSSSTAPSPIFGRAFGARRGRGLYWNVTMSVRLDVVAFGLNGSFARFALPEFKTL